MVSCQAKCIVLKAATKNLRPSCGYHRSGPEYRPCGGRQPILYEITKGEDWIQIRTLNDICSPAAAGRIGGEGIAVPAEGGGAARQQNGVCLTAVGCNVRAHLPVQGCEAASARCCSH